jgi:hypothetical protein
MAEAFRDPEMMKHLMDYISDLENPETRAVREGGWQANACAGHAMDRRRWRKQSPWPKKAASCLREMSSFAQRCVAALLLAPGFSWGEE